MFISSYVLKPWYPYNILCWYWPKVRWKTGIEEAKLERNREWGGRQFLKNASTQQITPLRCWKCLNSSFMPYLYGKQHLSWVAEVNKLPGPLPTQSIFVLLCNTELIGLYTVLYCSILLHCGLALTVSEFRILKFLKFSVVSSCMFLFTTLIAIFYNQCKKKLHGLSPRANYTDRATAACRRSNCQLFADRGCHVVSVTDPYSRIIDFIDRSCYFSIK
jgi:hypothetical protein